jgi:hypothetical protein
MPTIVETQSLANTSLQELMREMLVRLGEERPSGSEEGVASNRDPYSDLTAIGGPGKALTCICGGDEVTSAVFNYTTGPEHAD